MTSITAASGSGLTVANGTSTPVIGTDPTVLQMRINAACGPGTYMTLVNSAGGINCSGVVSNPGTVTNVSAVSGSGLTVANATSTPQINTDFTVLQKRVAAGCPSGQFLQSIGVDGTPSCLPVNSAVPNSTGVLLADYEFNETSGTTFADSSGFGNNAQAPIGGIAVGSGGHSGKAIYFAGGYVVAQNVPIAPQVWVEAWVSGITSSTGSILASSAYSLNLSSGNAVFTVNAPGGSCSVTGPTVPAGSWVHVAGWYNGLQVAVEVNGLVTGSSCANGPLNALSGSSALYIGSASNGGNTFNGIVDEVRIRSVAPMNSLPSILFTSTAQTTTTGMICGSTSTTTSGNISYTGGLTGYRAAKAMCEQACSSQLAHMCTSPEAALNAQLTTNVYGGWIATGTANGTVTDCNGWTTNSAGVSGVYWGNSPGASPCNSTYPIVCCR